MIRDRIFGMVLNKEIMKYLMIGLILLFSVSSIGQSFSDNQVTISTLEGKKINASQLVPEEGMVVMIFWSMNNQKSVEMLQEADEILGLTGPLDDQVKFVGICVDDEGGSIDVRSFVNGSNITMDVYIDRNNEMKRTLMVPSVPYIIYCNKEYEKMCMVDGFATNAELLIQNAQPVSLTGNNNELSNFKIRPH